VDLAAILEPYRELPAEPDRVDPAPANHLQATGGGGRL
jgi:hypothetical protein